MLNGDDVQIGKKKIKLNEALASPAIQPPEGLEDYLDSHLWVPSSSDKSLIMYTNLNPVYIIRTFLPYWFQHVSIQFCL